jgi:fructokinase
MAERVVVIGDVLIDELIEESVRTSVPGGSALNVAVGLARQGITCVLTAALGEDEDGLRIRALLADSHVDFVPAASPRPTGRATSIRTDGEPSYEFSESVRRRDVVAGFADVVRTEDPDFAVISGFPFDDEGQVDALAAALSDRSLRLIVDPNPRAGLLRDRAVFVRNFERIAASALLVKLGEEDAELLYGEDVDAVSSRLRAAGCRNVVATHGAGGAAVHFGVQSARVPIHALPESIIDTMGAGDAVLASICASLVNGVPTDADSWKELLQRAMIVAAFTCRHEGAVSALPMWREPFVASQGGSRDLRSPRDRRLT